MRKCKGPIFSKYVFTHLNSHPLPFTVQSIRSYTQLHTFSDRSHNSPHDILMSLRMTQIKSGRCEVCHSRCEAGYSRGLIIL